ncbi:MAG: TRAP transporter large permease subunit, partial [Mailhella sp.]
VILMEMGQITPPVGVNVFAMSTMARDVPMARIFQRIIPYFICMLILEVLLCIFPELATGLVSLLYSD